MDISDVIAPDFLYVSLLVALYGILLLSYRILLHPLKAYPGPFLARLSDIHNGYYAMRKSLHLVSRSDHQKYGKVIRHGPNKLLFNTPKALHDIYNNDMVVKSYVYSVFIQTPGVHSLFTVVDKQHHTAKRRIVGQVINDRAFSTSGALSALFFYLSQSPSCYERLATEIRSAFATSHEIRGGPKLAGCQYLRACIDEALRIAPPVPGTMWREPAANNSKPLIIDGHYIPPGTQIGVNIYAIHHNPEYFQDPFTFKPERWLSETPEAQRKSMQDAFSAFSVGYRGCAGKAMAYLESSLVVAKTLWYFDFERAPGKLGEVSGGRPGSHNGRSRLDEFQLYDIISGAHDGPFLIFTPRGDSSASERR
ncbi:hypothetical protein JX266_001861 [Neoarthrinium moseri]|nr:hypothetical protein JX266_001861 [Neoarthrinium moseri]